MQTSTTFVSNRHHRIQMTRHAEKRAQQRGFRGDAVQLIRTFGDRAHDGQGAVRYSMTDRAMKRVVRSIGRTQQIDALAGAYVVVAAEDETTVITVSHRWS
jgi:hypothetical protein